MGNATKLSFRKEKSQKGSPIKINILKLFKKQLKILHNQIQSNFSDKFRNCTVRLQERKHSGQLTGTQIYHLYDSTVKL